MWVYMRTGDKVWTVGFFSPIDGAWVTDSDHEDPQSAAMRVHWLNGGTAKAPPVTLLYGAKGSMSDESD